MAFPDFIDLVVEVIDGDVYVTTNLPEDIPIDLTLYDYDTAETVGMEEALTKRSEIEYTHGPSAVMAAHQVWQEYLDERSVPLIP